MIHFDSCFLLEGFQVHHKNVLKCLKRGNTCSVAVTEPAKAKRAFVFVWVRDVAVVNRIFSPGGDLSFFQNLYWGYKGGNCMFIWHIHSVGGEVL